MAKNTKQRQIIADVLAKAGRPLTTNEIWQQSLQRIPSLGVATVYREISRLVEAQELTPVLISNDPPRYETCRNHHHHFRCNCCERVYELQGCPGGINKLLPESFTTTGHDLTVFGVCRSCNQPSGGGR